MDRNEEEWRKLKERMPPSDEGALERFLASALATILTIIFSWHIIIDVYNDDNKSRRQITDVNRTTSKSTDTKTNSDSDFTKPQPSTSLTDSGIQSLQASSIVTSQQGGQNNLAASDNSIKSIIKEYKLTPATISRLEAVPDPIEIVSRSAHKSPTTGVDDYSSDNTTRKVCEPVLSSRTVPEEDSLDVRLLNRDVARVLSQSRDFIAARASPEDFDSVPLYADSGESSPVHFDTTPSPGTAQGRIQRSSDTSSVRNCDKSLETCDSSRKICDKVTTRKDSAMFDESWDMDPADDDIHQIYSGDDHDQQNSRGDFFFVPVDYDDSSEDDDDRPWRGRILEAISEEDEDDLSSSYHSSSSDEEESRFSDDSLNVKDMEIHDTDNSKLDKADQNLNCITLEKDVENDVNSNLRDSLSVSSKDSYFDIGDDIKTIERSANLDNDDVISSAGHHDNHIRSESESNKMASFSEGILPAVESEVDYAHRFSRGSPLLNQQTRQLCSSCEGLNTLEPSLSSLHYSGIVGRASVNDTSTMVDKSSVCNGDTTINLSNFDDSKLEYLEESYRDCDLSDCCKPAPRGFIFSQCEELESKSEILSTNYLSKLNKKEDLSPGAADSSSASCGVDRPCIDTDPNGDDQYSPLQAETSQDLNFKIPTVKTDSVYVIDLKDSKHAGGEEIQSNDEVRNQLLEQEQILDSKILVNSENSSGDESSTTTGDTAILNPGNRETTDDDVSEISEIDIDIIKELQSVASQPSGVAKHQVTDLDASTSESDDNSDDNSDSSDSFEFNKDDTNIPEREIPNRNRNLAVLDELEEEEESSEDSDEFHDASQDSNDINPHDLASSGSGSSPEDMNINPYSTDNLSVSPYFHTEINQPSCERTIIKRQRLYPDMVTVPEIGFFPQVETGDKGTQTVRSYRQPAVCTIDPERYFHPFKLDKTPFDVTTEYNTGDVEVARFVDVGIQVKFDPLWDKSDQKLVLSPSATPTRGSPVQCEGKLQPKELFFQYDNVNVISDENVFSGDKFEPNFDVGLTVTQRIRRPSSERRASYDAIDESEEDLLEESFPVLDSPPKPSDQTRLEYNKPGNMEGKFVDKEFDDDVLEVTTISCKLFDKSSEEEKMDMNEREKSLDTNPNGLRYKSRNGVTEILNSTEISSKVFDKNSSSSSDDEQEAEMVHRSPPKRRHRKSPPKTKKHSERNSSDDDERLVVEKVHIVDSSDADDESDEDARVPLMAKSDQSPLMSPSSPPRVESFIKPIAVPREETPPRPRESPPTRIQISPRPRPVPPPRVKPQDFISTTKVSPIEVRAPKPLYDVFNRPEKEHSNVAESNAPSSIQGTAKVLSKPEQPSAPKRNVWESKPNVPEEERRVQSSINIELKSRPPPAPLNAPESAPVSVKPQPRRSNSPAAQPQTDKKYSSILTEPIKTENKNISHLFTLPDKTPLAEREKINSARQEYLTKQQQSNEEERKKLLSRLLGTRDWSERDVPKPKSILKKTSQSFCESKTEDLPVGYKPTNLDTPNLANLCKSTENIKDRISRMVERKKEEDRERSRSRSNSRSSEFERGRPERRTLPANFRSSSGRAKSLDSLMDNKNMSLPRSDSSGHLYRSPSITLNKSLSGFFADRKSYTNLLETDLDSESVKVIPLVKETDLDEVAKTVSSGALNRVRSKSETRGSFKPIIAEIYNDTLEKTKSLEQLSDNKMISLSVYDTPEVVPVKKDSNRLSKSLGQLDLPDWYVNAPTKPEDVDFGLSCTKTPPSSTSTSFDQNKSFRSNTSFDYPRTTVLQTRVSPPRRTPSPKPVQPFELPSERFRRGHVPLSSRKIVSKMRPPGSKSMEDLVSKDLQSVEIGEEKIPKSESLSQKSVSNEKETPSIRGTREVMKSKAVAVKPLESKAKSETEVNNKPVIETVIKPELDTKLHQQIEVKLKPEVEVKVKPEVEKKPETRFTSSATLQLKPATPPKPMVIPASKPIPAQKTETSPTKQGIVQTASYTAPTVPSKPVAPPPPPPETKVQAVITAEVEPTEVVEPEVPVEPKLADCIFNIPFVDEFPQEEESARMSARTETEPDIVLYGPKISTFEMKPKDSIFEIQKPKETTFEIQRPKETTFEIQRPKETTFDIEKPKETTVEIQRPKESIFQIRKPEEMAFEVMKPMQTFAVQKPRETTFEIQRPKLSTFTQQKPGETTSELSRPTERSFEFQKPTTMSFNVMNPKETSFELERNKPKESNFEILKPQEPVFEKGSEEPYFSLPNTDTHSRLQAPVVQAACQPHEPKSFSTTPAQFYALNVIETDLDTSATTGSQRSHESLTDINNEPPVTERKWAPHETNVGAQIRHPPLKKPTPIETSIGSPRSPLIDDVTPRSPRETSFVSKPSPKLDSNPSSPRETSFLSKGKERTHFVFPRSEVTSGHETNIDEPSTRITVKRPPDVIQNAPRLQTFQRPAPPAEILRNQTAPTYQRPLVTALETSVDSSPTLQRHQRHPPRPEPSPIPPMAPRDVNVNYKTSTPIVRNQNFASRGPSRGISRETDIDADIIQQPRSAPVQFERSLDNDSFRFNAPQSESTPLNLSLESNSSLRQTRPRPQSRETDIDELPQRPPPRQGPPPVPYRQPRPPPPPPGSSRGPVLPPRSGYHQTFETDIDGDLPSVPDRRPGSVTSRGSFNSRPGSLTSRPMTSSRPGSVTSQTGSISDGYFEPEFDLATFKRMASEDPLVSTSSPRASPLDGGFSHAPGAPTYAPDHYIAPGAPGANTFGTNVRIDHSQSVYRPADNDGDSSHNTSLVEVLDGLLGMENSPRNSDDFSDPNRKRVVSEAKFDIFNDINKGLNQDLTLIKCRNSRCGKTLPLRQARTVYVSCTFCYSYYCTENCRSIHYTRHEERCTFSRVENSCKLVARRLIMDSVMSHQISGIARTGYQSRGRGCVLLSVESPMQCDQLINSSRINAQLQPVFISMAELDNSPKISDNAMDMVVDYNPHSNFILNVCCQISRRNTEFVKSCESFPLTAVKAPVISVNERLPREQWFYSVQNQLREHGVDLRQQYPDVYNQILQYIHHKTPFTPVTIYPVDSASGQTLFCSIAQDLPPEIRPVAWNRGQQVGQGRPVDNSAPVNGYRPPMAGPRAGYHNGPSGPSGPIGPRPPNNGYRAPTTGPRAPATDTYRPAVASQRAPMDNYRAPVGRSYAPTVRQTVPVGVPRPQGRPMYQPPRRANPASKETEL